MDPLGPRLPPAPPPPPEIEALARSGMWGKSTLEYGLTTANRYAEKQAAHTMAAQTSEKSPTA